MTELLAFMAANPWLTIGLAGIGALTAELVIVQPVKLLGKLTDGKKARLKAQSKYLLKENRALRRLALSDSPMEERMQVLESIVTDGDFELNQRLLEAARADGDEDTDE